MASLYPSLENIKRLKVQPTEGEYHLLNYLDEHLDVSYEVFFNPYLDGDRPDFIIVKEGVAIIIIEVKDYDLAKYKVNTYNKWSVHSSQGTSRIASPQSQAFTYKKNLYQLHLPVLGLAQLTNRHFFNLVLPLVYMHKATKPQIHQLYSHPDNELSKQSQDLFTQHKNGSINHDTFNKRSDGISSVKLRLSRDKSMVYANDQLNTLILKIKSFKSHVLFDDRVYEDLKRRLMPCEHILNQGKQIPLDEKQIKLAVSDKGKEKIKGVAGCGKTAIIAQRAVNAHTRHKENVLIITFNITLKNLIKDRISDILGYRDGENFAVTNYHQFYNSQINETGQDIGELIEKFGLRELYKKDCFKEDTLRRYQTILVDEVQDFESEWVKILRDNFLANDGEMVLFGDESQNIYERTTERAAVIAQGFGSWKKLKRSYRTSIDSPLNQIFKDYQSKYLIEKYSDSELLETAPIQQGLTFEILDYHSCNEDWENSTFDCIQKTIRTNNFNPNDVVILSSNIYLARKLVEKYQDVEKLHCMFETYPELLVLLSAYDRNITLDALKLMSVEALRKTIASHMGLKTDIERARRTKKNHFYANSGLIKLS
ncbi:nuclease-related domain-containing DEAD/DEAH box helicase [Psychromonas antarctica]|uniref:nuclease-related domain-containing DEAD/DEAH box helicase n=1 Tax=Psychromonas antarctica TaxID=67573 RepID=UPI001EE8F618|nr:NERD domain-containing protein/DEAD/DEAH box helicase [Psychromonas antarctica]MCG6202840.1 AAA family ATPase [Psychromonas antarctica]